MSLEKNERILIIVLRKKVHLSKDTWTIYDLRGFLDGCGVLLQMITSSCSLSNNQENEGDFDKVV